MKFEELTLHEPASWHSNVATGMTGLMWFWVFLRWSKDGETLLVRCPAPTDAAPRLPTLAGFSGPCRLRAGFRFFS